MSGLSDGLGSLPADGGPLPLVMLHGLFGDRDNLRALAARLDSARPVLRLDLPGHGEAPATDPLSFAAMARDIAARLPDALAAEGIAADAPVHLLGHSLGGKVAMTLASQPPLAPRLASLVVLDIGVRAYPPHHRSILDALGALDPSTLGSRREADAALAETIPDRGVRAFLLKSLVRDADRFRWQFDLAALDRDYERYIAAALSPVAAPATLPVAVIAGGASDYLGPDDDAQLRARFSTVRIDRLAGAGHWLHAERPDDVAELIERALLELERKAPHAAS